MLGKFGPIIWIFSNWLKFGTKVDYCMLILILMFIFSIFLSVIFFGGKFGPIIWSSTNWLKFRRGIHCCMLITILMSIFFQKFVSHIFLDKIWCCLNQNLAFVYVINVTYWLWRKAIIFQKKIVQNIMDKFRSIFFLHIDGIRREVKNNRFWEEIFLKEL